MKQGKQRGKRPGKPKSSGGGARGKQRSRSSRVEKPRKSREPERPAKTESAPRVAGDITGTIALHRDGYAFVTPDRPLP
ncbi:MAG: hypothetical protein ACRD1F_07125, partial [Terriglobales bacterium]